MQMRNTGLGKTAEALIALALLLSGGMADLHANTLNISNRYSPLNRKRPVRPQTRYIVLHTTEGAESGSLAKVRRYGETHYFVAKSGGMYRIIDRRRIATHAGRSMWEGTVNLDDCSIGIEVVGHYDREISAAQYTALRELLRQLQSLYGISDERVLTHSMVAYGRPNQFHSSNHRGRKRCGMIFARRDVRERLGLKSQPAQDADVLAGRLRVADPELQRFLYAGAPAAVAAESTAQTDDASPDAPGEAQVITRGINAWTLARERFNHPQTTYVLPNGDRLRGDQITDWNRIPVGTRVLLSEEEQEQGFEGFLEIGQEGGAARKIAGEVYADRTTIYFFPDGLIRTGYELQQKASTRSLLGGLPKGTRVLVGYIYGGYVKTRRPPARIAGVKWNYPSTFYRLPDGRIVSGDEIDDRGVPPNTLVFYQN